MTAGVAWAAAAAAAVLAVAPPAEAGAPAPEGAVVRIGSKTFTESIVLGELAAALAASAGARSEHRAALGGTRVVWEALRRGEIDLYPEYTGTLVLELLADEDLPPADEGALRAALARRGVAMSAPLGFENTYAIGMREDVTRRLGIRRISDLARHPGLRLGFTNEFMDRADGWPALRARYALPHANVRGLDHDLAYRALAAGDLDATDLYSTDADIRRHRLAVLEDDRRAFPEYRAVFLYRADLAARAPAALAAVRRLEGRLDARRMTDLNARAQLDGVPAPVVAEAFLGAELGLEPARAAPTDGLLARVSGRTLEHVALVAVALAAAVLAGIPLGVLAALRPGAGRAVLAGVGLIQTIPALALLVFMIPLLGIGGRPAVAALFLYGLLPIVRNTHAGLAGLSPELAESAASLGLSSAARLWRIELPLAAPSILAGVRTSAVITVGTATLGALIGAGGFGQPILAGIRLASVPLILEGAAPAALLALLAEAGFGAAERVLVPRGLRPRRRAAPR